MDAIFKTIDRLTGITGELNDYKVISVTEGKDVLAKKLQQELHLIHFLHLL